MQFGQSCGVRRIRALSLSLSLSLSLTERKPLELNSLLYNADPWLPELRKFEVSCFLENECISVLSL